MIEDDIFKLLQQQESRVNEKVFYYVHYDSETKKVVNFRNYLEDSDSLPFIRVSEDDIEDNSIDRSAIFDYKITIKDNKEILVKNENFHSLNNINELIFEVPKIKEISPNIEFDLLIEQDNIKKEFRLQLSEQNKSKFSSLSVNQLMLIYVTSLSDPNILYKTLSFKIEDLLKNKKYIIPFGEFTGEETNIFLTKYFQNYIHLDIR